MLRSIFVHALCLMICLAFVTALFAVEGVVISAPKNNNMEIKIDGKVEMVSLRGVRFTDAKGKRVVAKKATPALQKDAQVEVTKKGNKVTAIQLKN